MDSLKVLSPNQIAWLNITGSDNEDRRFLNQWAEKQSTQEVENYWTEQNMVSIDGLPTNY
jgi:ATP/maltotriose-dependent transcriptional regulator MalT